ncbi:hypothetical protein L917_05024 [Phytophthora nicotianae]|uniref:Uncharacterized protein n=1 Tax=Phytophthora nicotianae TaxID=4792 RepID=W2LMA5_PHYNI|nr:hypothetical protein L917_05024 [Phytophthora nicotianae]
MRVLRGHRRFHQVPCLLRRLSLSETAEAYRSCGDLHRRDCCAIRAKGRE